MKVINNNLSKVPKAPCDIDNLDDLPYIPTSPLPIKSFALYIVGSPGSGKTNLMMSLLTSKKPKYYRKFFCHIEIISGSLATLSNKFKKQLPDSQKHNKFSDDLIIDIVNKMKNGKQDSNENNLLVLDDVIRQITRSRVLSQIFLNRRHISHNEDKEGNGGLSIITVSQKYSLLPLEFRNSISDFVLFKSSNSMEINKIKDELLHDLDKDEQNELLNLAWSKPYNFLFIKINNPKKTKYYINFDLVEFN